MGVFKKLTGADIRVTPVPVKFLKEGVGTVIPGTCRIPSGSGETASRADFETGTNTNNQALVYNSIRQLFYGAFISQDFLSRESIFTYPLANSISSEPIGVFSGFDPSFQGSVGYSRTFPLGNGDTISVLSIDTTDFGESIVPGTVDIGGLTDDDKSGNLYNGGAIVGNIFYDQGIAVRTDKGTIGTATFSGSYTAYAVQYKCTAGPNEFNYSLNPTLLSSSAGPSTTDYNSSIVDSPEFMPYVTTVGLYNENQELMMVGKLAQPVQLNPYTDTNFIIRIDR